ncbi:succinate--CoA ligase subunit beta, partial [Candidatus Micrarchaeota archaeon]|nr:succinate--CoA ligase subunit beta [Candidatus Micrarchaeota archaeon]
MKLFENESKELFKKYGLPVPDGVVASGVGEVTAPCVVKALVLAGKRGKAKAVKVCKTVEEAKEFAAQLLGKNVLGESVSRLYLEQPIEFSKELFASITYDSIKKTPVILFSDLGGVDIEELARTRPEKLLKINVDVALGVEEFQLREELKKFGVESALIPKIASILAKLYVVFSQTDARICEA